MNIRIRVIESVKALEAVEELQKLVWSGSDLEIVPIHLLLAAIHGGGLLIGAYENDQLIGFVFGFPGVKVKEGIVEFWHCSHMAGIHPDYRDHGIGYRLKRAQWQMVRQQGIKRITWTYDPLQSRNAKLNIAKLGAVCNTYFPDYYGNLEDHLNAGFPTDRFWVDWWVDSRRVKRRLGSNPPKKLDLAHYLSAEVERINETEINDLGLVIPRSSVIPDSSVSLYLLEIPSDFQSIKNVDPELALEWRYHTRSLFEEFFTEGFLVTDFIFLPGRFPRSYYVLSQGEATL
jgi:predicted GNAT superfamily acetyltransferase